MCCPCAARTREPATGRRPPQDSHATARASAARCPTIHSRLRAGELFQAGVLRPDVFISDRLDLEDYPKALEQFQQGIGRKVQVQPRPAGA